MTADQAVDQARIYPEPGTTLKAGFNGIGRACESVAIKVVTENGTVGKDCTGDSTFDGSEIEGDLSSRIIRFDVAVIQVTQFLSPRAREKQAENDRRIAESSWLEWSEYGARLIEAMEWITGKCDLSGGLEVGYEALEKLCRYWDHCVVDRELELEESRPGGSAPGWIVTLTRSWDKMRNESFERLLSERRST